MADCLHYTHVNELKTLEFELREERVTAGCLVSSPLDLTGLTANLCFKRHSDGTIITRALTVLVPTDGTVSYTFTLADYVTDFTVGSYGMTVKVLNGGGDTVFEEEAICCPAFEVRETCV